MDIKDAIISRHSVRQYNDKSITGEALESLQKEIENCNDKSGLNIKLVLNDPEAFDCTTARYGKFVGVNNYIVLKGKECENFDILCGYYGEKIVLKAQMLGLNTCWVALTCNKKHLKNILENEEKLCCVITVGYGQNQGVAHKSKPQEKLYKAKGVLPKWFVEGINYAKLAPTALNQQKFIFELNDNNVVKIKSLFGPYTKIDLGIVKCHFEIGAGRENFVWAK